MCAVSPDAGGRAGRRRRRSPRHRGGVAADARAGRARVRGPMTPTLWACDASRRPRPRRPRAPVPRRLPRRAAAPAREPGVPVLPPDAPFAADARAVGQRRARRAVLARRRVRPRRRAGRDHRTAPAPRRSSCCGPRRPATPRSSPRDAPSSSTRPGTAPTLVEHGRLRRRRGLADGADLLLITSTFGDGDAPDNGTGFWDALPPPTRPAAATAAVRRARLRRLQLRRLLRARPPARRPARASSARRGCAARVDCEPRRRGRQAHGQWLDARSQTAWLRERAGGRRRDRRRRPAPAPAQRRAGHGPTFRGQTPSLTRLVGNRLLSLAGLGKEVRRFTFDVERAGVAYEAGDALGVWPIELPRLVDGVAGGHRAGRRTRRSSVDGPAGDAAARGAAPAPGHHPDHPRPAALRRRTHAGHAS